MAITSYKAVVGYYNGAGTPNITTAVTGQLSDGWIPIGAPILTDAYGQCTQMMAKTDATPVITTSAYTVVTAANPQPPDATWDAQGSPLWIDTTTYLQAYTKGGVYLQGVVPVSRGGTGAITAAAARTNLGVPASGDVLFKNDNLASLTDRAAAWLNVRPVGPTPLAADPVSALDATTKQWVEALRSVKDSWSSVVTQTTPPPINTVVNGGSIVSEYKVGTATVYDATFSSYGTVGQGTEGQGAAIRTGSYTWTFNREGALNLPGGAVQLATSRPDGAIVTNTYWRCRDVLVQPLNSIGVSAYERNAMRMVNFSQSTPGYVSYFSGDWYDGGYTFGGVRGTGTDLLHAQISINNGQGVAADFKFMPDGTAQAANWQSTSDGRLKTNITRIENPLDKMRIIKGVTWERLDKYAKPNGIGFIAQDVEKAFPDAVKATPFSDTELRDGTIVKDVKSVDTYGVAAALHHEAILALMDKVEALEAELAALKSGK